MKITKIACIGMVVAAMVACAPKVKTAEGTIADASMNNVTIITETADTLNFSTMNADMTNANGLLLGAPITVVYTQQGVADTVKVCPTYSKLVGQWVEPVVMDSAASQMPDVQGLELMVMGDATSINMSTLLYKSWQLTKDGKLVLVGESIGNGQSFTFSDTLNIDELTESSLKLSNATCTAEYTRQQ